jgi:formate-dependent nitrite reductase cytochrome c552 subunit
MGWVRTSNVTGEGNPVQQPVLFDHRHHVVDDGIDCKYCHSEVDRSPSAGIPTTARCMGCHSQVWTGSPLLARVRESYFSGQPIPWVRVNRLPDFVYFDHSIHVAKGVGCESCHGRVDRMPLTVRTQPLSMQWCLDCHRAPQKYLRPREQEFAMNWKAQDQEKLGLALVRRYHIDTRRLTDCSVCHR